MSEPESYGVREQTVSADPLDVAHELLRIRGYCVLDGGLTPGELAKLGDAFDAGERAYLEEYAGRFDLAALGERHIIRALPASAPAFLGLLENPSLRGLLQRVFGDSYVLNQVNGLINPPAGERFSQERWHRDLPYQHFVSSRPLAVNALFCLDPFTAENGATLVAPGTHKQEPFPSPAALAELRLTLSAPAGSFLVMDGMLFHAGGENRTSHRRRAVNHVFCIPPIQQQIALEHAVQPIPPGLRHLLDVGGSEPRSVEEWLMSRRARAESSDP